MISLKTIFAVFFSVIFLLYSQANADWRTEDVTGGQKFNEEDYRPAILSYPPPIEVKVMFDLTHTQHQGNFDILSKLGYVLHNIDGYQEGGAAKYATIWHKYSSYPYAWASHHGMTSSEYQEKFNFYNLNKGYYLYDVSLYDVNGTAYYAAIWRDDNYEPSSWRSFHGMTAVEYQVKFNELKANGFMPVDLTSTNSNGTALYAAIWHPIQFSFSARHGQSSSEYQKTFNTLVSNGYRLARNTGMRINDRDQYSSIFQKISSPPWYARHGMERNLINAVEAFRKCTTGEIVQIDGWQRTSQTRYNAIWENLPSTGLKFIWPVAGVIGEDWEINNYLDLAFCNKGTRVDYVGVYGNKAKNYDNHDAVDIDIPNFRQQDAGVDVYAAAEGIVEDLEDGRFDRVTSGCGDGPNYVVIKHPDGSKTYYYHLRKDSVPVITNQNVTAGTVIGQIGSSGCSSNPHLHFTVRDPNGMIVSPFLMNNFKNPPPYFHTVGYMDLIVAEDDALSWDEMKDPDPNISELHQGSSLAVGLHLGGGLDSDTAQVRLRRSDNSQIEIRTAGIDKWSRHSFQHRWYFILTEPLDSNIYVDVIINGAVKDTHELTIVE